MNPLYLAVRYRTPTYWQDWALLVAIVAIALGTVIATALVYYFGIKSRGPRIRGSPLTGTAQVLSLKQTRLTVALNEPVRRMMCNIGLRVEIPGRQPYDVSVQQGFVPWQMDRIQPGRTVPVQVDPANPQNVRIDFTQSITGPPSSAQTVTYRYDPANPQDVPPPIRAAFEDQFKLLNQLKQEMQGSAGGPVSSAGDISASGQRVPGVLMSFAANGDKTDSTYSRPELRDAPLYLLAVELHIPNLAPMTARNIQPVPPAQVPSLALGLQLTCLVDPADPSHRFAVDWDAIAY